MTFLLLPSSWLLKFLNYADDDDNDDDIGDEREVSWKILNMKLLH